MKNFKKYAKEFNFHNKKVKYKYYHSFRVKKFSEYLAKKLKLSRNDKKLASFIGLYHDIGRFSQVTEFDTFEDAKSIDHAEVGYNLLKKRKFLNNFNTKEKNIILKAVKNHNKFKIEKGLNNRELMHAKIIRDADKIDIIRMISKGNIFDFKSITYNISNDVNEDFFKHKLINNKKQASMGDKLIRNLSLVYDISFNESLKYLYKEKYFNKIYKRIPNNQVYKKYFDEINKYIEKRLEIC